MKTNKNNHNQTGKQTISDLPKTLMTASSPDKRLDTGLVIPINKTREDELKKDAQIFSLGNAMEDYKKENKILEKKIRHQKQRLTQFEGIIKEIRFLLKSKKAEIHSDLLEIYNNLEDDLTLDKTGESGYKNERLAVKAIKKYTIKVLDRKIKKWHR